MGPCPWEIHMKTFATVLLATLATITLGCGYGSNYNSGANNGTMPAIAQLSPSSATAGGQAFTLTVNGSNFASNAMINWSGASQASTAYVNGGKLTLAVPATMIANAGTVQVTVTNPATMTGGLYGSGTPAQTSAPMTFTIN